MKKIWEKIRKFWYFHLANPVVRKGERGGFKWCFRRFWLDISTVSGNFKARFTAAEHPYAYLLAGKDDSNIKGYCEHLYMTAMLLTTDQKLVNDIHKSLEANIRRQGQKPSVSGDSEEAALAEVKDVQEYTEMSRAERRRYERDVNKRFKATVKKMKDEEKGKE